ncbi:hypothetical protein C1646_694900 [Rhizophagus diaphanus]|nr:hypothetical protein C1646_694900 [Rhizophagus diaphanus] [Rhizophagus sp. MUCL 43196]
MARLANMTFLFKKKSKVTLRKSELRNNFIFILFFCPIYEIVLFFCVNWYNYG